MRIADVPAAVLAGGLATRLRPITEKIPKALVEVAGRPFIDHQLGLLHDNGIRHVVLCLGYLGEMVRDHVGDGGRYGLSVDYSFDGDKLLGTGGALKRAAAHLGEAFWVLYGDSFMDVDYPAILAHFASASPHPQPLEGSPTRERGTDAAGRGGQVLGLMTVLRNDDQWDASNVVFHEGRLICYDKRHRRPDMRHVDYGAALLRRSALDRIPDDSPFDLAALYSELVAQGRMIGHEVFQRFYEIGNPTGLAQTEAYLSARRAASGRRKDEG
jgi:NDP-sugar pyrophosphorylase family protein